VALADRDRGSGVALAIGSGVALVSGSSIGSGVALVSGGGVALVSGSGVALVNGSSMDSWSGNQRGRATAWQLLRFELRSGSPPSIAAPLREMSA
jgi:hypothetical protein